MSEGRLVSKAAGWVWLLASVVWCVMPVVWGAEEVGMVRIAKVATPPSIDGELRDACWNETPEMAPFVLQGQKVVAREQTCAYLAWDDERLYVAFRCRETCLDPVNNQMAQFRAATTEKDHNAIFSDDCLLLLLDTDTDHSTFFDLCVNALGTVNDARCAGDDPWSTRDKGWDSGVVVAARRFDGFWCLEMAVPFARLDAKVREGEAWRVGLGRLQQSKGERSTWQPMGQGFHDPAEFGEIVFAAQSAPVRGLDIGTSAFGENQLTFTLPPGAPAMKLRTEVAVVYAGTGRKVSFTDTDLAGGGKAQHNYVLDREGPFGIQCQILDPASLTVYYRSPLYCGEVAASLLTGKIRAEADYWVYVNGEEVLKGGKGEGELRVPLFDGVNVLGIETDGGIQGDFAVGPYSFTCDRRWKFSTVAHSGWAGQDYDDSAWDMMVPDRGPGFGPAGKKGFYRKTLVVGLSSFWPNWSADAWSVAENAVQQLLAVPQGLPGRTLRDYRLILDVPTEFQVIGASGFYGASQGRKGFCVGNRGIALHEGKEFYRYVVHALDPVSFQKDSPEYRMCSIGISLPDAGGQLAGRETVFYHSVEAEDGAVMEIPQRLRVRVLPPLRGRQPLKYHWMTTTNSSRMDDLILAEALAQSMARAGLNDFLHGERYPRLPGTNVGMITFNTWDVDCRPWLEKHPEDAMLGIDGKLRFDPVDARRNLISPALLLRDTPAWAFVEQAVVDWVKARGIQHVCWDYEYSVWDDKSAPTPVAGFGPQDVADFRDFAKLPPEAELTPQSIREKHAEVWVRFMNRRMADLAVRLGAAVRKADPKAIFSVYSGYQSDETRSVYGVDWTLLAGRIDLALCGYGRPGQELRETLEVLGSTPLMAGDCIMPHDPPSRDFPTCISKATLLRRAVDGTAGILVWWFPTLDGRTFFASAEISRLVAEHEDLFVTHQRDDSLVAATGIPSDDVIVFTDGKKRLVLLLNERNQALKVTVVNQNLTPDLRVWDYFAAQDLGNAQAVTTDVAAHDVRVFVIEAKP
ncbi:MAG: hypothetical protein A3K19_22500 [Lentisphaerae bacterium RIFOXYB12_FULL_65_16]|nr:MAG: hypothetical protein A3K18_08940 [Lentisphaerae bacterium RIFOXYA12_64_32]OGV93840.1 MAG: hypothetical protein A3K19_22500 [Lentisphaerae bacterium RIFOXYB12_FULL_65_16]